jgi:hypothetical protein
MQKNFEKRDKDYLKMLKGKQRIPVLRASYFQYDLLCCRCGCGGQVWLIGTQLVYLLTEH